MNASPTIRNSVSHPGLVAESRPTAYGVYIVFTFRGAMDAYAVEPGKATWADCSDRASMPRKVADHCCRFAQAVSLLLAQKAVA